MAASDIHPPKVFISHSWTDKPLVLELEEALRRAGAAVWVDHVAIRGGDSLPKRISDALEWCDTLLLIWSQAASESEWVALEWENAISLKKKIIPCLLDGTKLPGILASKAFISICVMLQKQQQLCWALWDWMPNPWLRPRQRKQSLPCRTVR